MEAPTRPMDPALPNFNETRTGLSPIRDPFPKIANENSGENAADDGGGGGGSSGTGGGAAAAAASAILCDVASSKHGV